jgi:hypothetical protein
MRGAPLRPGVGTVVLVEGASDRDAVLTLARRSGLDPVRLSVTVVDMGGATNVGRHVRELGPGGLGVRLFGLCDDGESAYFARRSAGPGCRQRPTARRPPAASACAAVTWRRS